jgi:nitrogen regulatory protein PII
MGTPDFDLILFCCILDFGKGSKMFRLSKEIGAWGGIVLCGKGTVREEWLKVLGITETRKEIFFTIVNKTLEDIFYQKVSDKFSLRKSHHGIAFSIPLRYFVEGSGDEIPSKAEKKGMGSMDYEAIVVIANKNDLDDVLDAAEAAGSTGGTVIHGRGAGSQEKATLFNIEIEPEKIVVLILSRISRTKKIVDSIKEKLDIHKPNAGIIFIMNVSRTLGLYEG